VNILPSLFVGDRSDRMIKEDGMSELYGVFRMRLWQRDFQPMEIFHNRDGAREFAEKLMFEETQKDIRWVVYRRSQTDWEIL